MKKFECKECGVNCEVTCDGLSPSYCLYDKDEVDWQEVKEDSAENAQFGNSEQLPSNPRKLPDWANVGKWMYNIKRHEYCKILHLNQLAWISDEIKNGDYIKARERPFNADEMKELVGKVIEGTLINFRALIHYYTSADDSVCTIYNSYNAKELMENHITIDGKPCFKLEHLNDKGDWVE